MVIRTIRLGRRGFTITESIVALAVMVGVGALVAEHAFWSISERKRSEARLEATEAAANILEQARDTPWQDLNAEWANTRRMPETIGKRWPESRLQVRVEPDPKQANLKRVSVEVTWGHAGRSGWQPVVLTSLFASRMTEAKP